MPKASLPNVIPPDTVVYEDRPIPVRSVHVIGCTAPDLRKAKRRRVREHLTGGPVRFSYTGPTMRMTFLSEAEQRRRNRLAISAGARQRLRALRLK